MILSVKEAARKYDITCQAIFVAIRNQRLKAKKKSRCWEILEEDLRDYRNSLYSRKNLRHNGELVFPPNQGILSVPAAARMLGVGIGKIYHGIYKKTLKHVRKGHSYVLNVSDVLDYARFFLGINYDG